MTNQKPRERIEPNPGNVRYVRRDARGRFTSDQSNSGRSLGKDARQHAKTGTKAGHGDRGDRLR
jgi:hypothetical protein